MFRWTRSETRALADRVTDRPVRAVAVLAAVALAVRLVGLGARPMHWDEARVGYWTLRYAETGAFAYRPIIHGPFLPLVTRPIFELLGPSAFAARLPVAVLGGLFPLVALLFRESGLPDDGVRGLADAEVVALGALLAVDPALLYYSRFFRSDLPLAVFGLAAFGFGFRALATGRRRHLVAAGVAIGLALTTKENAIVSVTCIVGAAGVALVLPAVRTRDPARVPESLSAATTRVRGLSRAVPVALVAALLPVGYFYAPRGAAGDPSFAAVGDPARWPALLERVTLGTWATFAGSLWTGSLGHSYLPLFGYFSGVLLVSSLLAVVCGVYGAVAEWRTEGRGLVLGTAAWAAAALLGYPLADEAYAPWLVVHVVVPLVLPAAVGVVAVLRRVGVPQKVTLRNVAVCLLLVSPVAVGVATSFVAPASTGNPLVHVSQPADDMTPFAGDVAAAADDGGVLYYGDAFFLPNESAADAPPAPDDRWPGWWVKRLPLPWYTERADATTSYARHLEDVRAMDRVPPVVVVDAAEADAVAPLLDGYERASYDLRTNEVVLGYRVVPDRRVVVFVDREALE